MLKTSYLNTSPLPSSHAFLFIYFFITEYMLSSGKVIKPVFIFWQTYTSQIISLVMFALVMCDDRLSMQRRRNEIIEGLRVLPGNNDFYLALYVYS